MTYTTDPRVDAYIAALPAWQQAICRDIRALVHAADPEITEAIKRTNAVPPLVGRDAPGTLCGFQTSAASGYRVGWPAATCRAISRFLAGL
jgi:hypothetical protein